MTKKYFKLLLSLGVILCILCTSLTVSMAAPDWEDYVGPIETETFENVEEETTEEEVSETEPTTKKEPVTQKPTRPATTQSQTKPAPTVNATEKVTTEKTTKETTERTTKETTESTTKEIIEKTTKETITKTTKAEIMESTSVTNTETTDEDEAMLKDGQFFVYLERNNGERRLKTVLDKPGLVPQPNAPVRIGYIFKGWFKNPECTEPWDFTKSVAEKGTVIYAKWEADANTVAYKIKVQKVPGGTIAVNPGTASVGEPVIITVKPDEGKRLVAGSITINGKNSDVLSFIMPKGNVVVGASFEDVPDEKVDEKINPIIPIAIAVAVFVVILIVAIIIIKYKTRPAIIEYDENGAIILDDDDDDGWVDESIVIEDGFANGRIVRESMDSENNYEEIIKMFDEFGNGIIDD